MLYPIELYPRGMDARDKPRRSEAGYQDWGSLHKPRTALMDQMSPKYPDQRSVEEDPGTTPQDDERDP